MKAGDKFEFKGFEWVVLNPEVTEGGVLAMMTSTWNGKEYPFDEDGCNNWKESSLKKKLEEELLPVLGKENLLDHTVDLEADNGDKEYGADVCKVFILSCWEYRRYRDYVPRLQEWMWTCTPRTTTGSIVRLVNPDGSLSNNIASITNGLRNQRIINRADRCGKASGMRKENPGTGRFSGRNRRTVRLRKYLKRGGGAGKDDRRLRKVGSPVIR